MRSKFFICFVCLLLIYSNSNKILAYKQDTQHDSDSIISSWGDRLFRYVQELTLEEKASQVLMVTPSSLIDAGGYILFSEHISDYKGTKNYILTHRSSNKAIPPFIAVDEEGGRVSRLSKLKPQIPTLTNARRIANSNTPSELQLKARTLAYTMRILGFNMNFAPVLDVDTNKKNPIIGDRSYSMYADKVILYSLHMAFGLKEGGVVPVVKHFPGHGDTYTDTHEQTVRLAHNRERLDAIELKPFVSAITHNLPVIMASHLIVEAYDPEFPASLSKPMLTDLLRNTLGFRGLIVTDALDMAAITSRYTSQEVVVMALNAGADLLLMPENPIEAKKAILRSVETGELSIQRLDDAVYRILSLKRQYGIFSIP
jgi:beta-N-acetylhexosaminidase